MNFLKSINLTITFLCFTVLIHAQTVKVDSGSVTVKPSSYEAHWAGMDVGTVILMNNDFGTDFSNNPYWENDIANSTTTAINLLEFKLPIAKQYLGLVTGLGYQNTNISFRENYVLNYDLSLIHI